MKTSGSSARRAGTDRMSPKDHLVWRLETQTDMRPSIVLLFILDGTPERDDVVHWHEQAAILLPRMRARVVPSRLPWQGPRWVADPHFSALRHIRHIALPGKGTRQDLLTLTEALAETPFVAGRPPWESYVIEGLEDGNSALLMKISHCIADGLRLREMLLRQTKGAPRMLPPSSTAPPARHQPVRRPSATTQAVLQQARTICQFLLTTARDMADLPDRSGGHHDGPARRYFTLDVPLNQVRTTAKAADGTVQDVLVAALAEGWRRYNEQHRLRRPRLRVFTPYGRAPLTRHDPSAVGNHWFIVRFHLPAHTADAKARIRATRTAVQSTYTRTAVDWMGAIARLAPLLPGPLLQLGFERFAACHDLIVSNIPGPRHPLTITGRPTTHCYGVAPSLGAPLSATIFTCDGTCHIALSVDPAVVSDPDELTAYMQQALTERAPSEGSAMGS